MATTRNKPAQAAPSRLQDDPRWQQAVRECDALAEQLATLTTRYDELRGAGPDKVRTAPDYIERARRLMAGQPQRDPMEDLNHVADALDTVRRAEREAGLRLARVERELCHEHIASRAPERAALRRKVLEALRAVAAANAGMRELADDIDARGFGITISADRPGFAPEAVDAEIAAIEAELLEAEEESRDYGSATLWLRLLVRAPMLELADAEPGDVIELPEKQARRLIRAKHAEVATAEQRAHFKRHGRPLRPGAAPAWLE